MKLLVADPQHSPARVHQSRRDPVTVAAVQTRWHEDPTEHCRVLADGMPVNAQVQGS